jgi:hypothetical protein
MSTLYGPYFRYLQPVCTSESNKERASVCVSRIVSRKWNFLFGFFLDKNIETYRRYNFTTAI